MRAQIQAIEFVCFFSFSLSFFFLPTFSIFSSFTFTFIKLVKPVGIKLTVKKNTY